MRELMMLIEVRTDGNIQGSEQLSDEVKTVVQTTLDRFSDRIRRVDFVPQRRDRQQSRSR